MTTPLANSLAAYQSIQPHLRPMQQQVLTVLEEVRDDGYAITDEEGVEATGMIASSYRTRRKELERMGLVKQAGNTLSTSGRTTATWVAK